LVVVFGFALNLDGRVKFLPVGLLLGMVMFSFSARRPRPECAAS
jgi:hypothetical protein